MALNELNPPIGSGAKAIRAWVKEQMKAQVPRGLIYVALLDAPFPDELEEMEAVQDAQQELGDILTQRNIEGEEAERKGNIDRAIELYEENVEDRFDGSHPYDRLRIIYARLGRYEDAIRVCNVYLQDLAFDPDLCNSYNKWISKYRSKMESEK